MADEDEAFGPLGAGWTPPPAQGNEHETLAGLSAATTVPNTVPDQPTVEAEPDVIEVEPTVVSDTPRLTSAEVGQMVAQGKLGPSAVLELYRRVEFLEGELAKLGSFVSSLTSEFERSTGRTVTRPGDRAGGRGGL